MSDFSSVTCLLSLLISFMFSPTSATCLLVFVPSYLALLFLADTWYKASAYTDTRTHTHTTQSISQMHLSYLAFIFSFFPFFPSLSSPLLYLTPIIQQPIQQPIEQMIFRPFNRHWQWASAFALNALSSIIIQLNKQMLIQAGKIFSSSSSFFLSPS